MSNQPEITLASIKPGREGWVYLVHAEGTNRYKIGRSVNPVARHQVLQGQSPYPLKILKCFWTVDAVTDEAWLHKFAAKYRAYGEWFDLVAGKEIESSLDDVETAFNMGHVMSSLAHEALNHFFEWLELDREKAHKSFTLFSILVLDLYYGITDKVVLVSTEQFMRKQLLELTSNFAQGSTLDQLNKFLVGALGGFAAAHGRILV